jgi:RHS repeat-associated protein
VRTLRPRLRPRLRHRLWPTRDARIHNTVGRTAKNSTSSTYDTAGQLTAVGSTSYGYDSNGNQTSRGSDSFGWDFENRLTSATVGGTQTTYTYNADGLRQTRASGGTTTSYVWDVTTGAMLQDGTSTYVYGLGLISTTDGSENQTYYLKDGLGNTIALCNGSGTVTATYTYDVFGAVRTHTGVSTEFNFTGEDNDPNGLEYLRARYYDNATGRFMSGDPLGSEYGYAGGNPVNMVDPTGLENEDTARRTCLLVTDEPNLCVGWGYGPLCLTCDSSIQVEFWPHIVRIATPIGSAMVDAAHAFISLFDYNDDRGQRAVQNQLEADRALSQDFVHQFVTWSCASAVASIVGTFLLPEAPEAVGYAALISQTAYATATGTAAKDHDLKAVVANSTANLFAPFSLINKGASFAQFAHATGVASTAFSVGECLWPR